MYSTYTYFSKLLSKAKVNNIDFNSNVLIWKELVPVMINRFVAAKINVTKLMTSDVVKSMVYATQRKLLIDIMSKD